MYQVPYSEYYVTCHVKSKRERGTKSNILNRNSWILNQVVKKTIGSFYFFRKIKTIYIDIFAFYKIPMCAFFRYFLKFHTKHTNFVLHAQFYFPKFHVDFAHKVFSLLGGAASKDPRSWGMKSERRRGGCMWWGALLDSPIHEAERQKIWIWARLGKRKNQNLNERRWVTPPNGQPGIPTPHPKRSLVGNVHMSTSTATRQGYYPLRTVHVYFSSWLPATGRVQWDGCWSATRCRPGPGSWPSSSNGEQNLTFVSVPVGIASSACYKLSWAIRPPPLSRRWAEISQAFNDPSLLWRSAVSSSPSSRG